MSKVNKKIVCLSVLVGLFCLVGLTFAQLKNPIEAETFDQLLGQIISGVAKLITSLGTIMIIVAGILYLTSAGSQERMGTAKKALVYAIIGITLGLVADAVVKIITEIMGAS